MEAGTGRAGSSVVVAVQRADMLWIGREIASSVSSPKTELASTTRARIGEAPFVYARGAASLAI